MAVITLNNRVRYTRQNLITNSFYQLPKFLFDAELADLSDTAKVLYAIIRNRHEISIKNGWHDENDEVYLYFKREDMQAIMKRSDKAITKAIKELKELVLLEEVRQGMMKPNRIYLLSAVVDALGIEVPETLENTMTRTMYESRPVDCTNHDPCDVRVINNQKSNSHNNINNSVKSSQSVKEDGQDGADAAILQMIEDYTEIIKDNIEYDSFTKPEDREFVDEIIMIIVDAVTTRRKTLWIDGEEMPRVKVKSVLMKLGHEEIQHVIAQFRAYKKPIAKKKRFILTTAYNSKSEINAHYTNLYESNKGKTTATLNGGGSK